MTTSRRILILAATVALACAPRTRGPAATPPPVSAPHATGSAQKPAAAEPSSRAAAPASAQASARFSDIHAGLEGASSQDCLGCHADTWPVIKTHGSHPIDLDYSAAASKRSADFTPLPDVIARGVALPGGKIACLTCHGLSSPWKYHLAMPAGATVRPAVRLDDPSSYEEDSPSPPLPGSEVSPKPLCRACHTY